jgi:hypothetical protein
MHGWFGWGYAVWMTIGWLTAVGVLLTLVWSLVLSASLRYEGRKSSETHVYGNSDIDMDEYTRVEEVGNDKKAA